MDDISIAYTPQIYTLGVRPNTAGKPRKDASQLSTNKHIKRARKYILKLIRNDLKLYKARARDASVILISKKRLKALDQYLNISKENRFKIIKDNKRIIIYYR